MRWIWLLLALAACGGQSFPIDDTSAEALSCSSPNPTSITQHFTVCGVDRTAVVSVPARLNPAVPSALYIALHGLNGSPSTMQSKNVWYCLGDQAVSVYPQGVHQPPPQNGLGWDIAIGGCDDQFLSQVIAWTEGQYTVVAAKLRCYGFSMGSLECQVMAMAHPGLWGAMALVSTEIPWTQSPPAANSALLSYFQDQGALDQTFPILNGRAARDAWLAAIGWYTATQPGYDSQFTSYVMTSTSVQATYGECPTCGHGWYPDTSPAMASWFQGLGL